MRRLLGHRHLRLLHLLRGQMSIVISRVQLRLHGDFNFCETNSQMVVLAPPTRDTFQSRAVGNKLDRPRCTTHRRLKSPRRFLDAEKCIKFKFYYFTGKSALEVVADLSLLSVSLWPIQGFVAGDLRSVSGRIWTETVRKKK